MAKVQPGTELATRQTASQLQASRPEFLKKAEQEGPLRRGQEEMSNADMVIPRVAVCQDLTPNKKRSNPNYIEGLEAGHLFNTVTLENYGESVQFTPLLFYKSRIKFRPMDQGGGIECMNPTGKRCALNNGGPCLYAEWGPHGEKPQCDELFNYPAFIHHADGREPDFAVVSFKRTALAAARDLNSKIRMRNADTFAGVYVLRTTTDKNKAGQEYFIPVVENAGWVSPELYAQAERQYDAFRQAILSGRTVMDTSGMENESQGEEPF